MTISSVDNTIKVKISTLDNNEVEEYMERRRFYGKENKNGFKRL